MWKLWSMSPKLVRFSIVNRKTFFEGLLDSNKKKRDDLQSSDIKKIRQMFQKDWSLNRKFLNEKEIQNFVSILFVEVGTEEELDFKSRDKSLFRVRLPLSQVEDSYIKNKQFLFLSKSVVSRKLMIEILQVKVKAVVIEKNPFEIETSVT